MSSSYIVTVSKTEFAPDAPASAAPSVTEIFRQTFETIELSKIVQALNKAPRASRKAKAAKV